MVNSEEILDNGGVAIQENILDNLVISSSSTTTVVENTNFCDEETQDIENLISRLPEEVLQKVFSKLARKDLSNAAAVCSQWRRICEWPAFWAKMRLSVKPKNLQRMPQVLAVPRLEALKRLRICQANQPLFNAILCHQGLIELDMRYTDLSSIPPDLLAAVISRMEVVVMFSSKIEREQAKALMEALANPSSNLKVLNIGDNCLSSVCPKVFARAASRLERLEVAETSLTASQASALLEVAQNEDTQLKILNISNNWLTEVSPPLVAKGLGSMECVEARRCDFNQDQLIRLLQSATTSESRLKKLDIGGNRAARDLPVHLVDSARNAIRHLQLSTAGFPVVGS